MEDTPLLAAALSLLSLGAAADAPSVLPVLSLTAATPLPHRSWDVVLCATVLAAESALQEQGGGVEGLGPCITAVSRVADLAMLAAVSGEAAAGMLRDPLLPPALLSALGSLVALLRQEGAFVDTWRRPGQVLRRAALGAVDRLCAALAYAPVAESLPEIHQNLPQILDHASALLQDVRDRRAHVFRKAAAEHTRHRQGSPAQALGDLFDLLAAGVGPDGAAPAAELGALRSAASLLSVLTSDADTAAVFLQDPRPVLRLTSGLSASYLRLSALLDQPLSDVAQCCLAGLKNLLAFVPHAKLSAAEIGLHEALTARCFDCHSLLLLSHTRPVATAAAAARPQTAPASSSGRGESAASAGPSPSGKLQQAAAALRSRRLAAVAKKRQGGRVAAPEGASEEKENVEAAVAAPPPAQPDNGLKRRRLLMVHLLSSLSLLQRLACLAPDVVRFSMAAETTLLPLVERLWALGLEDEGILHELLALLAQVFPRCAAAVEAATTRISTDQVRLHPLLPSGAFS